MRYNWCFAVMSAVAVLTGAVALPHAANASGRVYGSNHASLSRKLAALNGVFAVWCIAPDEASRELDFHIVLAPGARASVVAPEVRGIMAAGISDAQFSPVDVDIWTYHDPLYGSGFRRIMADIAPGVVGFPDYRGEEVDIVSAVIPPDSNPTEAVWSIEPVRPGHWANPQTL